MLHEFIQKNKDNLIDRCRAKVAERPSPPVTAAELEYGVPLILEQLIDALRLEGLLPLAHKRQASWKPTRPGLPMTITAISYSFVLSPLKYLM